MARWLSLWTKPFKLRDVAQDIFVSSNRLHKHMADGDQFMRMGRVMIYSRSDACWAFQERARLGYSLGDEWLRYLCAF